MAKTVTIRNVPETVHAELAARASATGRSLQAYLHAWLIELASRPDPDVLRARVRERKQRSGTLLSLDEILGPRNADRR